MTAPPSRTRRFPRKSPLSTPRPAAIVATAATSKARRAEPEHDLQVLVAAFLEKALAGVALWSSIDAGAGRLSKRVAGRRKARGVKAGWPDILVLWRGLAIGIELKAGRGSTSAGQDDLAAAWAAQGGRYAVCRSLLEVDAALAGFGIPLRYRVSACGLAWVLAGRTRPGAEAVA